MLFNDDTTFFDHIDDHSDELDGCVSRVFFVGSVSLGVVAVLL